MVGATNSDVATNAYEHGQPDVGCLSNEGPRPHVHHDVGVDLGVAARLVAVDVEEAVE